MSTSLGRPARALLALLLLALVWTLAARVGRRPADVVRLQCPDERRPTEAPADDVADVADVVAPALHHLLPHLLQSPRPLRPVLHLGDGLQGDPSRRGSRATLSLAIGVEASRGGEHVVDVLQDLVHHIQPAERDQTLVVVLVGPGDFRGVEAIRDSFGAEAQSGLLEVISAPDAFYPPHVDGGGDEDDARRVLDVSFLMMYSQERAEFYLQLSDAFSVDGMGFATKMQAFAMDLEAKQEWIAISYSTHRFYGNLFLCSELPRIVQFFLMFYNDHNLGDLFENLVHAKACQPTAAPDECVRRMSALWVRHRPPLVSAVGVDVLAVGADDGVAGG